jgi:glycine betaine/proline transport system substrate-binding protein
MIKLKWKKTGIIAGLSLSLIAAGCGQGDTVDTSKNGNGATPDISEEVDYTITGIEPGAGMMGLTKDTLEEYENLEGWNLLEGSTAGMLIELDEAIKKEEPIVVTGWNPHWMFAAYDLKYLEDPKGTFGEVENINT